MYFWDLQYCIYEYSSYEVFHIMVLHMMILQIPKQTHSTEAILKYIPLASL